MLRNACLVLSAGPLVAAIVSLSSCGSDEPAASGRSGTDASVGGSATPDASAGGSSGTGGKGTGGAGGTTDGGKDATSPPCGNGKLDPGEACDTAISAGQTGACPSASTCDDGDACTKDVLSNGGTCNARCDTTGKVAANASTKDQCCPSGATSATDADCSPTCGNGTLDTGEDCDPQITSGQGACITQCGDGSDPCQKVVTADPCKPTCSAVTAAASGDSCCPPGATSANDDDCTPSAFRMTKLVMFDPHPSFDNGTVCVDFEVIFNAIIDANIAGDEVGSADGGPDGNLDLNFVVVTRPERHSGTSNAEFYQADCTTPSAADGSLATSSCKPNPQRPVQYFSYTNQATGTCLATDPQYETASYPHASPATAGPNPCAVSAEATLSLALSGLNLVFDHARVAGQWDADPATGIVQGLFAGFLTEARAQQNFLPQGLGALSGQPLTFLFPTAAAPQTSCPTVNDADVGPDGSTRGWWWYLNFEAVKVRWAAP
jgi:hypothetical protein